MVVISVCVAVIVMGARVVVGVVHPQRYWGVM